MEEKGVSGSFFLISEENSDSLYPMFIGASCAFFALRLLPTPEIRDEKWSEIRNRMLNGSALLGLLVWTVQRNEKTKLLQNLDKAQMEIAQLKKQRSEDAKANERVVSIFAAREQSWFGERRNLAHQIASLTDDLRVVEAEKALSVSDLVDKMKEIEVILQLKDKMIEEAERRRSESDEKLRAAEDVAEELRENLKSETENHSAEISKHKTAFIELVSNQRQLEAEMGRAFRQVEAAKEELDVLMEEKEKVVLVNQRLSVEIVRMHKDLERRSRLDAAEKEMLLKEVRSSKAKRRQAEVEAARWKAVSESKHDRISLRNMFLKHVNGKSTVSLDAWNHKNHPFLADRSSNEEGFMSTADAEKVEQKHKVEIYDLMEKLRQKDEKVEAYNWRLMSTELESRRLQSHIEALDRDIAQLRQDNAKLEGIVLNREAKLHSLQEQMMRFVAPNPQFNTPRHDADLGDDSVWSRVKVVKREAEEMKEILENDKVDGTARNELQDIVFTLEKPSKVMNEGRDSVSLDDIRDEKIEAEEVAGQWKMDIHALGVSFKVKRLKQQLFVLERLIEREDNSESNERVKGLYALRSFLNKQADRYLSLQGKIDQLSKRMQEKKVNDSSKCGGFAVARAEEETKRMEHFLEETFQLQRFIVATGQKLMEVQSKIASSLVAEAADTEKHGSFDIERFGESLKTLFRETQRGLEVRISRIIGDLEGSLARDGFNTWRRRLVNKRN